MQELTTANRVGIANGGKKPRMRRWSEKHHLLERQNTETDECSGEGDWAVSGVAVVVKILNSLARVEVIVTSEEDYGLKLNLFVI